MDPVYAGGTYAQHQPIRRQEHHDMTLATNEFPDFILELILAYTLQKNNCLHHVYSFQKRNHQYLIYIARLAAKLPSDKNFTLDKDTNTDKRCFFIDQFCILVISSKM